MRKISCLFICPFMALALVAAAHGQEKNAMPFEKRIQGAWLPEAAPDRLMSRLVVRQDDKGLTLEILATRGLRDELVQKTSLKLLRAGIGDQGPFERAFATWTEGDATLYLTLRTSGKDLAVDLTKIYREPTTGNWFVTYALKTAMEFQSDR